MKFTLYTLGIALLMSCSVRKHPQIICETLQETAKITVEMLASEETDNPKYELYGVAFDNAIGDYAAFIKIIFRRGDGQIFGVFTDVDGQYKIELTPGVYELECAHPGFISYKSEFTAIEGMREKMNVYLED